MSPGLRIRSSDGLSLEAGLDTPDQPRAALVLCHPHPKMGGTMNAPLLLELSGELVSRGWAVLRFNFRGLGTSEGEHGLGIGEVADATGALAYMSDRYDVPLAIAGWSFGGAVALRAALTSEAVAAVALIAPAVKEKPGITAGLPDPREVSLSVPLLVVVGANDELVEPHDAEAWARSAGGRSVVLKGANHFFWAKYEALAEVVSDFLDGSL